jgi:paraquat-inducible protein B
VNNRVSPALIGSFVVSGIALVVAAVIVFGSGRVFQERESFVSFFPGSVNGLTVGSNVSFRGVNVGTVRQILLSMGGDSLALGTDYRIPVVFDIDQSLIQSRGARVRLGDPEQFQQMLEMGMSARLDTESILTGRLYVALDFRPDGGAVLYGATHEYPEIPTVPSPMAEVQDKIRELADRFSDVDLEEIFTAMRSTLDGIEEIVTDEELQDVAANVNAMVLSVDETVLGIQKLVMTVDTTVGPVQERFSSAAARAETSMKEIDETMDALEAVLEPDSPLIVGLVDTLEELQLAAQSLRRVAELIDRDPSILVRGRATGGGS